MKDGNAGAHGTSSAPAGGAFSFPLLKPSEIFSCIHEMRVPVQDDEIRACQPEAVRKVLEAFIESMMGVTREDMAQPAFEGLSALSSPELHSESIPELSFFRTAHRLLDACGVHDFALKDVLAPSPKRVRRHLSALINFAKFREERVAAFSDLTSETDEQLKRKAALQEENAALQRQLDALLQEQAAEAPAVQQLTEECQALEVDIDKINDQQQALRYEMKGLKKREHAARDELASARFNLLEAAGEIERLQGQIVTSPNRVKKELREIATALEDAKTDLYALERRHRELLAQSDTYVRAEKDLAKTFALLAECEQEISKTKQAKEKVKNAKQAVADLQRQTSETQRRRKRLEKHVKLKKAEFERYQEEARVKDRAAAQALRVAREELQKLEATHQDARQRIARNTDASRELERQMKEDELKYQRELHDMEQMYSRLQLAAEYYNNQLLEVVRANP